MSARKKSSPKNTKKPALLRYFFDTEFLDDPYNFSCELVSIGILNEKGQEYYGISNEFNLQAAKKEPWIKEHVIDKLDPQNTWESVEDIRQGVLDLFEPAEKVELWARNGSYDNVLICQLFGGMGEFFKTLKEEKGIGHIRIECIASRVHLLPDRRQWRCLGHASGGAVFMREMEPKLVLVILDGFQGRQFNIRVAGKPARVHHPCVVASLAMDDLLGQQPAVASSFT